MNVPETPSFYTEFEPWAAASVAQFKADHNAAEMPERLVISDADDTLIDSTLQWYNDYVHYAVNNQFLPTTLEVFGESRRRAFAALWLVDDEYDAYKKERMHSIPLHVGMVALHDAASTLAHDGMRLPNGYISTRPAVLGEVTADSLRDLGFARTPLLVRPPHIDYADTVDFKEQAVIILNDMVQAERELRGTTIEYVDDYAAVADAINGLHISTLVGTHYGPHTSWGKILRLG